MFQNKTDLQKSHLESFPELYRYLVILLKYIHSYSAFWKGRNEEHFTARHCSETTITKQTLYDSLVYFLPLPYCSITAKAPYFLTSLYTFNAGTYRCGTDGPPPPTKKLIADGLWILYFLTVPSS